MIDANPTLEDVGKPCPHNSVYGKCGSSMCYIHTREDLASEGWEDEEALLSVPSRQDVADAVAKLTRKE